MISGLIVGVCSLIRVASQTIAVHNRPLHDFNSIKNYNNIHCRDGVCSLHFLLLFKSNSFGMNGKDYYIND